MLLGHPSRERARPEVAFASLSVVSELFPVRGKRMAGKSITRADLTEAVYKNAGLSRAEAAGLVEQVIEGICSTLATGETVKLSGFGIFTVRDKNARVGRNPKTG